LSNPTDPIDIGKFEETCGVGVVYTPEQIKKSVTELLEVHRKELLEKRYKTNLGFLLGINLILN
jgi:glutaminyl-tRNA synthetase